MSRNDPRTGAFSTVGVVGGFGAVIVLAFGGPEWTVAWLVAVLAIGAALHVRRVRRNNLRDD